MLIEIADPIDLPDEDLLGVYEIERLLHDEIEPDDPMRSPESFLAYQRADRPNRHRRLALARDGGQIRGTAGLGWRVGEENRHLARVDVGVHPEFRRQGIGQALLRAAAEHAAADRRTLIQAWASSRMPAGEHFARAVGARLGSLSHENRLRLADVDGDLLQRWVDVGESLPDYELLFLDGGTPRELLEAVAAVTNVMNTAPRDDLAEEDETITAEDIETGERAWLAGGHRFWRLFARHRPSGELVGYTLIGWEPEDRRTLSQGDTGVLPEHRGRGVAKWLKAAMLRKVLAEITEAQTIVTGNAMSNDAMLAINHALGFRPAASWQTWEVEIEAVLRYTSRQSARQLE